MQQSWRESHSLLQLVERQENVKQIHNYTVPVKVIRLLVVLLLLPLPLSLHPSIQRVVSRAWMEWNGRHSEFVLLSSFVFLVAAVVI